MDKQLSLWYNISMRKAKIVEKRKCPHCAMAGNQILAGKNRSGSQKCFCNKCKKYYTLDPKTREIPEETKNQAIKMFFTGISARKIGQFYGFSKANVLNWIKKNERETLQ